MQPNTCRLCANLFAPIIQQIYEKQLPVIIQYVTLRHILKKLFLANK